ncbi:MAG: hypothetical protein BECKG1743D_GA0114223_104542 [Candidatus Kentron sp. G]|nr:MAG: hypothetical protein BECKG1743D_GA0114223_104542 [Candidatus Kentron sp. G]VFN05130.1 MAG: hypothetical protein BECKG1743E_GA0114224_108242 [Candidatus Kentron sp. G]
MRLLLQRRNWTIKTSKLVYSLIEIALLLKVVFVEFVQMSCMQKSSCTPKKLFGNSRLRRLAEKNIPNCAGFSSGFKAQ